MKIVGSRQSKPGYTQALKWATWDGTGFTTEASLFLRAQYPTTDSNDYRKIKITLRTQTFQFYCRTDISKQDTNNSMCHAFRLTPENTFSKMAAISTEGRSCTNKTKL